MTFPNEFYPDLVKPGDLAACLLDGFGEINIDLKVKTFREGMESLPELKDFTGILLIHSRGYAHIEYKHRSANLFCETERRMFSLSLTDHGIGIAHSRTPDITGTARLFRRWILDRVSPETLASEFCFIELIERKSAREEVEERWNRYQESIAEEHPDLIAFFEVASRTPKLRELYPFTSMYYFCFSRCTHYPFTNDCPVVKPLYDNQNRKTIPNRYEVHLNEKILRAGNAQEAVQLVLDHLPDNCGPASSCTADYL